MHFVLPTLVRLVFHICSFWVCCAYFRTSALFGICWLEQVFRVVFCAYFRISISFSQPLLGPAFCGVFWTSFHTNASFCLWWLERALCASSAFILWFSPHSFWMSGLWCLLWLFSYKCFVLPMLILVNALWGLLHLFSYKYFLLRKLLRRMLRGLSMPIIIQVLYSPYPR